MPNITYSGKLLQHGRERHNARWILPLILVAGYLGTFNRFESFAVEYAVLTGFSIFACCLLLTRLNKTLQVTLPFWVILALFILAYYVKFYWITAFPEMEILSYFFDSHNNYFSSTDALFSAFVTTTYAFGSFCFVSWLLLGISRSRKLRAVGPSVISDPMPSARNNRFVSTVALWIALVLIPVTTFIMHVAGIAVMGVESVSLPFHLAGLVFFTRSVFVPTMLLLLIWSSQQAGLPKRTMYGVILLLMFGLSDTLLRSSRGGLAGMLLLLGFLLMVSKQRVQRRHFLLLVSGFLLASFTFPIIAEYRNLRIGDVSGGIVSLLVSAQHNVIGGGFSAIWDTLKIGISSILLRLTGVDMLIAYHGLAVQPLGDIVWSVITSPGGISGYVTVDVFGYPPDAIHASAPALVGWFYLIGGNHLCVIGMAGFMSAAYILWCLLERLQLKSLAVAQVLFLSLLLSMALEGTLDTSFNWALLALPASIAVCEWLIRVRKGVKRPLKNAPLCHSNESGDPIWP